MKKITLLLFFLLPFFHSTGNAQDGMYSIMQVEQSQSELRTFFEKRLEKSDSIILVIYFYPGSCPRCEGLFSYFLTHKSAAGFSNIKTVGIASHTKDRVVAKYIERQGFLFDKTIMDLDSSFQKMFKYTGDVLKTPFAMLIDAKNGELLNAASFLGMDCSEKYVSSFFKQIEPKRSYAKQSSYDHNLKLNHVTDTHASAFFDSVYTLVENKDIQYSGISDCLINKDNICFVDDILGDVFVYDIKGRPITAIIPTSAEFETFRSKSISDDFFSLLKPLLKCLYLKTIAIDSNQNVSIIASLPRTDFDTTSFELSYSNEPVILRKDFENQIKSIVQLKKLPSDYSEYSYLHKRIQNLEDAYFMPVLKGWPVKGTSTLTPQDSLDSPFKESFYQETPLGVLYDKSGNFKSLIGELSPLHNELKTGYFLSFPIVTENEESIFLADAKMGIITEYTKSKSNFNKIKSYQVFKPLTESGLDSCIKAFNKFVAQESGNIGVEYFEFVNSLFTKRIYKMFARKDDLIIIFEDEEANTFTTKILNINTFEVESEITLPIYSNKNEKIVSLDIINGFTGDNHTSLVSILDSDGILKIGKKSITPNNISLNIKK
ncbi:MAG: hypothetical protein IT258_18635 [Saprospiraceae bacterium]|nr:hypothetical protein [Saprospiraceae bacterium]